MMVYLDIVFIQYCIINYFLIEMTTIILKEKSKIANKIFATIIASLYPIITWLLNISLAEGIFEKLLLSTIIVFLIYKPKNIQDIIIKDIILYTVTYLLGGIFTSFISQIKDQQFAIIISCLICTGLVSLSKLIMKSIVNKDQLFCNIKIMINNRVIMAKAFIDTGNNLHDLVTGDTVVIINENKIEEFSQELFKILNGIVLDIPNEFQTKIRMISYNSLGNDGDILYGIKADEVSIYYDGKEIKNKNVVIALNKSCFDNFDALVGLELLEGGYVVGNSFIVKNESKKVMG